MMTRVPTLLLVSFGGTSLLGTAPWAAAFSATPVDSMALPTASSEPQAGDRQSLEKLLEETELERTKRLQALRPKVAAIIATIDEVKSRGKTATTDSKKRELIALGPDAQTLLIPFLNPGSGEQITPGSRTRARIVAEVMHDVPYAGVTDELLDVVRTGTPISKVGALYALRTTKESKRVLQALVPLIGTFGAASGKETEPAVETMRGEDLYTTIACLDCPGASDFLAQELYGRSADRRRMALEGIRFAPMASGAPQILNLIGGDQGAELASAIADYYEANEVLFEDSEHSEAVVSLALNEAVSNEARQRLFNLLRLTDAKLSSSNKRRIDKGFADATHPEVRRSAQLLLARNGGRGSKRDLLQPFDERLERGRNIAIVLRERAQILHDIGEWSSAVKDWRDVMKLQEAGQNVSRDTIVFVGIAKSLARQKKFREAAEYLSSSPLSLDALRNLAADRDFREMVNSKYVTAFHLEDQ